MKRKRSFKKLVLAELKKVRQSSKFKLGVVTVLILNVLLFFLFNGLNGKFENAGAYKKVEAAFNNMSMAEKSDWVYEQYDMFAAFQRIESILRQEYMQGYKNISQREKYADVFRDYYDLYIAGDWKETVLCKTTAKEFAFWTGLKSELDEVLNYRKFIADTQIKADHLSGISLYSSSVQGFDQLNIAKAVNDFKQLEGVEINFYPSGGIEKAIDYRITDILLIVLVFFLSSATIQEEKENGLLALIATTRNGRFPTAAAKLSSLYFSTLLSVLLLYGSNLLISYFAFGFGDLSRSIQSLPLLMHSTLQLNVLQYVLLFLAAKWVAILVISIIVLLVSMLFKTNWVGYLAAVAVLGVNLIVRTAIPATSTLAAIKYFNCISLLNTHELMGTYFNININGQPVSRTSFEFYSICIFVVLLSIAFIIFFSKTKAIRNRKELKIKLGIQNKKQNEKKHKKVLAFEIRKTLLSGGTAIVLLLYVCFQVFMFSGYSFYETPHETSYRTYMEQLEGTYTMEKYEWLQNKYEEFIPIIELSQAYNSGLITLDDLIFQRSAYGKLEFEKEIIDRIITRNIRHTLSTPGSKLLYDTGYVDFFDMELQYDSTETIAAAIVLVLCCADIIAKEKATGMLRLIKSTRLGRGYTARCKIGLSIGIGAFVAVVSLAPRWAYVIREFGLPGFFFQANSLFFFSGAPRIFSIAFFALLSLLLRVFVCVCTAMCITALSSFTGKIIASISVSTMVFCVLPILSVTLFPDLRYLSIFTLFHAIPLLFGTGVLQASVWLAFVLFGIWGALSLYYIRDTYGS
ncbi:MAG: hypothetical protein RSD35_05300 [Oscillospiraceae bacterium]